MGVRILQGSDRDSTSTQAALYCSTSGWAFGPIFDDDKKHDAFERADMFLKWLRETYNQDARQYTDSELSSKYSEWLQQEADQWKKYEESQETE